MQPRLCNLSPVESRKECDPEPTSFGATKTEQELFCCLPGASGDPQEGKGMLSRDQEWSPGQDPETNIRVSFPLIIPSSPRHASCCPASSRFPFEHIPPVFAFFFGSNITDSHYPGPLEGEGDYNAQTPL